MKRFLSQFMSDQTGATAIEYGMIAGFVALGIIAAVNQLGITVRTMMYEITAAAVTP